MLLEVFRIIYPSFQLVLVYYIKKDGWVKVHDAVEVDKLHYQYAKEKSKVNLLEEI